MSRPLPEHCLTHFTHRVGVAETDMMGIVHHASYVTLFERSRLEYMRRRGMPYKELVDGGHHLPVVELSVRYKKPAHFDDLLDIECRLSAATRVTLRFDFVIRRAESESPPPVLVEGHVRLACIDDRGRPRPLPSRAAQHLVLPENPDANPRSTS